MNRQRGSWRRSAALLVAAAALAVGLRHAWWVGVEHRFETVTPGRLYKSAEMPPAELVARAAELDLRTVVDLRKDPLEAIEAERAALAAAGVRHVHLPAKQVPDDATVDAFLALVADPDNLPALVHCEHGTGRSVLFSALYRIELEGWDNEEARRATRLFSWRGSFRPGSGKGEYLRAYEPRLERGEAEAAAAPAAVPR